MKYNFGGFTGKGNEALNNAISAAETLGHTFVGSEHLLLGILMTGGSVACTVLEENNLELIQVEKVITRLVDRGIPTKLSPEHLTPRAKRIVEKSIVSAKQLGKQAVGTEHILLELLSEGDNYAIRVLNELGIDIPKVATRLLDVVGMGDISADGQEPSASPRSAAAEKQKG